MAGIWNINSVYNNNLRRVTSKLSFELNQTFAGRVIDSDDNKSEVIIKLADGWQFPASVDRPLEAIPKGLVKFQVIGFEDGKLKLKLVADKEQSKGFEESSLDSILAEHDIDMEEYHILEGMVKHNMPLTRENIAKVKNLADFMNKLQTDPGEEGVFIERYLSSKEIVQASIKGKLVEDSLRDFFQEFKTINLEDLLTLLENNVDLSAENLRSYKRVFKEELGIFNDIGKLKQALEHAESTKEVQEAVSGLDVGIEELQDGELKYFKDVEPAVSAYPEKNIKQIIEDTIKEYTGRNFTLDDKNETSVLPLKIHTEELSMKLKTLLHTEADAGTREKILIDVKSLMDDVQKSLKNIIEDTLINGPGIEKRDIKDIAEIVEQKLTEPETGKMMDEIRFASMLAADDEKPSETTLFRLNYHPLRQQLPVSYSSQSQMGSSKGINILEALKEVVSKDAGVRSTLVNILKYKTVDTGVSEYQQVIHALENMPEKTLVDILKGALANGEEAVINDQPDKPQKNDLEPRKNNLRAIAGKITGIEVSLTDEECDELLKLLENNLEKGTDNKTVKGLGMAKIHDKADTEIVKEQIWTKTEALKSIVKDIISAKTQLKPEAFMKIMDALKHEINDFKVFNTVSNQYYFMDLPLKLKENEYSCKLIIKDDRKMGKKLDSKNVKLVVSVNTVNIGTVDGYIKVYENNMSIDIKCEEQWMDIFSRAKEKLIKNLSPMGYNLYVNIDKREAAADLSNCREFFGDSSLGSVNVRV